MWGLEPIETSISVAIHAVLHAQNDRWSLGPRETCYSSANHADLHAQNDRWGQGPIQTYKSGPKVTVLHEKKKTYEGWNPYRLVILVQITLFFMHKTTGNV